MEKYPESEIGAINLLYNRQELGQKMGIGETAHTPPASHYPHIYLWDSCFAAIINARCEGPKWQNAAQTEMLALVEGQRADGFIANMQFAAKGRRLDPERLVFEGGATGSNYTQPPILALAASEICNGRIEETGKFLETIYPSLKNYYSYLETQRSNSPEDKLIGVIHPHETGRDSDPTFDHIKPLRLPRHGIETPRIIDKANIGIDYLSIIAHGIKLRSANGNVAKSREIFWVNDVMMNCMYADNLREMSDLALASHHIDDSKHYRELAGKVEQQILSKMWDPKARGGRGEFRALDQYGRHIKETSISNLFPLVLRGLDECQLESLLDLMDSSFDTPFPLPSVATDSPNYDPHNRESDRLWRGPNWINVIWYLADRGLRMQVKRPEMSHRADLIDRCQEWDNKITKSVETLVDKNGPREHYNPITAAAQRRRVKTFAWSNLRYVM